MINFILSILLWGSSPARADSGLVAQAADLANQGHYQEAAVKFQEAVAEDPKNPRLRLSLGLVYQSLRRYEQAIASIEEAVRLEPSLPEAHYCLGLLYETAAINHHRLSEKVDPKTLWKKAYDSWSAVLRLEKDAKKKEIAAKHLKKVKEELEAK